MCQAWRKLSLHIRELSMMLSVLSTLHTRTVVMAWATPSLGAASCRHQRSSPGRYDGGGGTAAVVVLQGLLRRRCVSLRQLQSALLHEGAEAGGVVADDAVHAEVHQALHVRGGVDRPR